MYISEGDAMEKWKRCTAREKALVITAFLNECGEHAAWEEWLDFLNERQQLKSFEWIFSGD
jgi:hypothetical protein